MQPNFVSAHEINQRSRLVSTLAQNIALEKNKEWIGWIGHIMIDEIGKKPGSWIGRNFAYKPIVLKNTISDIFGQTLEIEVVKAFNTYLEGQAIS
jgi:tRNA A37 methylthiotransferase MiaB